MIKLHLMAILAFKCRPKKGSYMSFLYLFAKRFVAGEELEEAMPPIKELNEKGIMVTFDHLGENVNTEQEATAAADSYLQILEVIQREPQIQYLIETHSDGP